jgi:hypothetical protein
MKLNESIVDENNNSDQQKKVLNSQPPTILDSKETADESIKHYI